MDERLGVGFGLGVALLGCPLVLFYDTIWAIYHLFYGEFFALFSGFTATDSKSAPTGTVRPPLVREPALGRRGQQRRTRLPQMLKFL